MKKNNNVLKDIMEEDEEEDEKKDHKVPSCIICIGSTGCGKSATISKYTKLPISSNDGTNRVTQKCSMYHRPNDTFAWIDTVGLDDAQFDDEGREPLFEYLIWMYKFCIKCTLFL